MTTTAIATKQEREGDEDTLFTLAQLIDTYGGWATLAGMAAYQRVYELAVNYNAMTGSQSAWKAVQIVNAIVVNKGSDTKRTDRLKRAIINRTQLRK